MWELDLWGFPVVPVCRCLVLWVQIFRSVKGSSAPCLVSCFCHYRLAALHNTHTDAGSHGFPTEQRTVQTSSVYTLLIFKDFLLCTLKMFIKKLLELIYMTLLPDDLEAMLVTLPWEHTVCSHFERIVESSGTFDGSLSVSRSHVTVSQRVLMNNVTASLLWPSRLMLSTSNVTESAHSPCYKLRCCVLHSCACISLVLTSYDINVSLCVVMKLFICAHKIETETTGLCSALQCDSAVDPQLSPLCWNTSQALCF